MPARCVRTAAWLIGVLALLSAAPAAAQGYLRLAGHGGPVTGVAVSPDGRHALTASFDYAAGLWDLSDGARWCAGSRATTPP